MSTLSSGALSAIVALAAPDTESEFKGSSRMGDMFAKAQVESKKAAEKALIGDFTEIVDALRTQREQSALAIRNLEARIAEVRDEEAVLTAAFEFGESGGNYLPLLNALGLVGPGDYRAAGHTEAAWLALITMPEADESAEDAG